ncbi:unnamed protein product [Ilex paraguariensis]|uniref:BZIP domain-containing protein n=1 Tax=Ilex paraguariensis TaxID=185542 RepID=A0ABC8T8T8_9AQUA
MGNNEEGKSCKPEKPSSPAVDQNQTNIHMYPDWAAMQAYYGPRVAVPPYFNSAIASGHTPHPYMWGPPQPMMPPYGAPYAAIYAHGGVFAHPGVPLAASPLGMDTPAKSSANTDQGLMKKWKGFEGLAMSIGNANSAEGGVDHGLSQSGENNGSSDISDENTARAGQNGKKRSREGTPNAAGDGKTEMKSIPIPGREGNGASEKVMAVTVTAATTAGKVMGTMLSPSMSTVSEPRNPASENVKTSPTSAPQPTPVIPNEPWLKNERELKRERRKQSNRESARRSRLRKQAESEELAVKVESLNAENMTLKSEFCQLTENADNLKLENAKLMEKLKNAQLVQKDEVTLVSTEDLLVRVNNSGAVSRNNAEADMYEKRNSGAKLHQLLDAGPRTDAVAAG